MYADGWSGRCTVALAVRSERIPVGSAVPLWVGLSFIGWLMVLRAVWLLGSVAFHI